MKLQYCHDFVILDITQAVPNMAFAKKSKMRD
jgi:hypothetical protein